MLKKYRFKKAICLLTILSISLFSCGSADSDSNDNNSIDDGTEIIPTNLNFDVEIVNTTSTYPNGDGSGLVKFTAFADNSVKYKFITGTGDEIENTTGLAEYTYTKTGSNPYTVTVYAYSSTNHSASTFKSINVYVKEPELTLVWSDEFDIDGAIDTTKWTAEVVPPDDQKNWWNGEKQHYTDRTDNAYVSDGTLKIVAKKEEYTFINSRNESITKNYTSARINTQNKFQFTYGRIDVRAKLPKGQGTWPAIWTLGANITDVGWPKCGEIDIMEHWGHEPSIVSSATHNQACSGGCNNVTVGKTTIPTYNTDFHIYSILWNENEIKFYIDENFKYAYKPSSKNNDNWPYKADQFLILNVAMGGSWFQIDSSFTESQMEVDYIRVYQ